MRHSLGEAEKSRAELGTVPGISQVYTRAMKGVPAQGLGKMSPTVIDKCRGTTLTHENHRAKRDRKNMWSQVTLHSQPGLPDEVIDTEAKG